MRKMTDKQYNEALSVLKHGGSRPNAGRPKGTAKPDSLNKNISIRLSSDEQAKIAASGLTQREIFLIGLNSI